MSATAVDQALAASIEATLGGDLYREVEKELRLGFELQRHMAFARQRKIAEANHRNPRRLMDGLGQVTMSIDPVLRGIIEHEYGRGCFKDKSFVRELLRDNEMLRVKSEKRPMITVL